MLGKDGALSDMNDETRGGQDLTALKISRSKGLGERELNQVLGRAEI
jgi:hypothetical protein